MPPVVVTAVVGKETFDSGGDGDVGYSIGCWWYGAYSGYGGGVHSTGVKVVVLVGAAVYRWWRLCDICSDVDGGGDGTNGLHCDEDGDDLGGDG